MENLEDTHSRLVTTEHCITSITSKCYAIFHRFIQCKHFRDTNWALKLRFGSLVFNTRKLYKKNQKYSGIFRKSMGVHRRKFYEFFKNIIRNPTCRINWFEKISPRNIYFTAALSLFWVPYIVVELIHCRASLSKLWYAKLFSKITDIRRLYWLAHKWIANKVKYKVWAKCCSTLHPLHIYMSFIRRIYFRIRVSSNFHLN